MENFLMKLPRLEASNQTLRISGLLINIFEKILCFQVLRTKKALYFHRQHPIISEPNKHQRYRLLTAPTPRAAA
jgi:hypothetical protein